MRGRRRLQLASARPPAPAMPSAVPHRFAEGISNPLVEPPLLYSLAMQTCFWEADEIQYPQGLDPYRQVPPKLQALSIQNRLPPVKEEQKREQLRQTESARNTADGCECDPRRCH